MSKMSIKEKRKHNINLSVFRREEKGDAESARNLNQEEVDKYGN